MTKLMFRMMTKLIPRIPIKLLRTNEFMLEVSNNLINLIVLIELMIIKMVLWTILTNRAHLQEDQEELEYQKEDLDYQEDLQMTKDLDLEMKDKDLMTKEKLEIIDLICYVMMRLLIDLRDN